MAREKEQIVTDGFVRVEHGPYRLRSDRWSVWITKVIESKNGVVYEKRVAGFCTNIADLAESFIDSRINDGEAQGLKDILKEIAAARKDAMALIKKYLSKAGAWKK